MSVTYLNSQRGVEIAAPPALPNPYGLLSVAPPVSVADPHWLQGVEFESLCGGRGVRREAFAFCPDPQPAAATPDRWCQWVSLSPFAVFALSDTSVQHGIPDEQLERQTRARLLAGEASAVEQELRAQLALAVPAPQTVAITGYTGRDKLIAGVAYLEQRLNEVYPSLGVIHVDRMAGGLLGDYLSPVGGRLVTPLGTPVAVEATGDDGAAVPTVTTMYATGQMVVYNGPVETTQFDDLAGVNDVRVKALRPWLVGWDCTAIGATVTF